MNFSNFTKWLIVIVISSAARFTSPRVSTTVIRIFQYYNGTFVSYLGFTSTIYIQLFKIFVFCCLTICQNMPSNCNQSIRSCAFYRPPHLRNACVRTKVETVDSVNNNTSKCVNKNYSKVNNNNEPNLQSKELFTKLYVPPAKRNLNNVNNVGLSKYFDFKFKGTRSEYLKKLVESTTVYVGNLNLLSTEADVHKLFSEAGKIKTIIMGLDKQTFCPGGFCFVEYETRAETEYCMKTMNGSFLDGKQLLVDWDAGFIEGRQYSRVKRNQQRSYMHPNTHK